MAVTTRLGMRALLVLVVVSGPPSCGGDFVLLDPLKSPKSTIYKGSLGPKSPSPGGCGPLLVLVVAGGAHRDQAILGLLGAFPGAFPGSSQAGRPRNPPTPRDLNP